jgi:tetratricopeptide (TPR) repeat protein
VACKGNEFCERPEITLVDDSNHTLAVYRNLPPFCNPRIMTSSDAPASVWKEAAESALARGDIETAAELLDKALAWFEGRQKSALYAYVAVARADVYWNLRDLENAQRMYLEALPLLEAEHGSESRVVGICLRNLAEISSEAGDKRRATRFLKKSQNILRSQQ